MTKQPPSVRVHRCMLPPRRRRRSSSPRGSAFCVARPLANSCSARWGVGRSLHSPSQRGRRPLSGWSANLTALRRSRKQRWPASPPYRCAGSPVPQESLHSHSASVQRLRRQSCCCAVAAASFKRTTQRCPRLQSAASVSWQTPLRCNAESRRAARSLLSRVLLQPPRCGAACAWRSLRPPGLPVLPHVGGLPRAWLRTCGTAGRQRLHVRERPRID